MIVLKFTFPKVHKGGAGSGHHGHSGRPGKVGGSSGGSSGGQRQLTGAERYIVSLYKRGDVQYINHRLRKGESNIGFPAEIVATLDNLIAETQIIEDTVLYRYVVGARASKPYTRVGHVVEDKAFMSASTDEGSAVWAARDASRTGNNAGITLEILTPRGTNIFDIQSHSIGSVMAVHSQGNEREILLGRNTRLQVVSYDAATNKSIVRIL